MPNILLAETTNKVSSLNPGIKAVTNSMRYCDFPQLGKGHDWIKEYKQMTDFELFTKVKQLFSDLTMRDELKNIAPFITKVELRKRISFKLA